MNLASPPLTVMFQAPNGVGLGHLSRLTAIAQAVRRQVPDVRLPFLVEGGSHWILEEAELPFFSFPHHSDLVQAKSWAAWSEQERSSIVREVAGAAIRRFAPQIIVFDSFPCPYVVQAAVGAGVPLAVCCRKTRDDAAYFREASENEAYLQLILIPHEAGEVDVPPKLLHKVRFVGTIQRSAPKPTARDAQRGTQRIVITGGGGGYPNTVDFYNLALSATTAVRGRIPGIETVLVTGPLFRDWWRLDLADRVRVVPFESGLAGLISGADLVLCQAGYNTIAEIGQVKTPAICIPAPRIHDDQFARADAMAQALPHFSVFRGGDSETLALMIERCLRMEAGARVSPPVADGADRAAGAILAHLGAHAMRAEATEGGHS